MCFSAGASFAAAGVLGGIGIMSMHAVRERRYYALAAIPLFFAAQQAVEGMVWISHGAVGWATLYACFAYLLWPVWTPCAVLVSESQQTRRRLQLITLGCGIFAACAYALSLVQQGILVTVAEHIEYQLNPAYGSPLLCAALYIIAVAGSCLLASKRLIQFFGCAVVIAALMTMIIWQLWFTSVWCFFAALLSCGIYAIIRTVSIKKG